MSVLYQETVLVRILPSETEIFTAQFKLSVRISTFVWNEHGDGHKQTFNRAHYFSVIELR